MVSEVLKWNGRVMKQEEVQYLDESLTEIALRIAALAKDISAIAEGIRESVGLTKEINKSLLELSDLLSGERLINLEKGLKRVRMELIKKAPMYAIHDILKGEFRNKDVIRLMEELYKAQQQKQTEALPPDIKELLKGSLTPSQFVVRRRVEAERRGS